MTKIPQFIAVRDVRGRVGSEFIGVTRGGGLSIYAGFYSKHGIREFTRCLLHVDKNQGLIGIQFGGESLGEGSYKLTHDSGNKTASVAARNFFRLSGLDVAVWYGKYKPTKVDDQSMPNLFMIDIDTKILINRKSKKEKTVI